jgi:hypothetical protein
VSIKLKLRMLLLYLPLPAARHRKPLHIDSLFGQDDNPSRFPWGACCPFCVRKRAGPGSLSVRGENSMKNLLIVKLEIFAFVFLAVWGAAAQQSANVAVVPRNGAVPRLVSYSGILKDANGRPVTGVTGVTFMLYKDETGGAPIWLETQNVKPDATGDYSVQLGAASSRGLSAEVFMTGESRWLGVQISSEPEQARVQLVAVPYAMKAADAETVGGLPPSAFVLAAPQVSVGGSVTPGSTPTSAVALPASVTGSGTSNFLPLWSSSTALGNSVLFQSGSGTAARVGINTVNPAATLDVTGGTTIRGLLNLPNAATATASAGADSRPFGLVASTYSSSTKTAANQVFHWQAEPVGNNTASPSATLNLLFATAPAAVAETGLKINNKGQITFASGQTFPSSVGTVKSVGLSAPSSDFTVSGSPVTTSGTLELNWKVPPTSSNTANAIVKRDANGAFTAGGITSTSSGVGVVGQSSGTNAVADGVDGVTGSATASGVAGINNSGTFEGVGVYGAGGIGVYGTSTYGFGGFGAWGQYGTLSDMGGSFLLGDDAGVFGDGGTVGGIGVMGTTDENSAGYFANNSAALPTLQVINGAPDGFSFSAVNGNDKGCNIDSGGNLNCTGSKNAVVPIDGGKRKVALSAIESPKNWFEDAGAAELVNGSAVVTLDPDFIQTINTNLDYHVFLTPNGDSRGLYVTRKTAASFEVREQGGGTSSIGFDYRVMALRKNYENVRFADHTNDPDPRKMMERMNGARPAKMIR